MTRTYPFDNRKHKEFSIETKQTQETLSFETLYCFKTLPNYLKKDFVKNYKTLHSFPV